MSVQHIQHRKASFPLEFSPLHFSRKLPKLLSCHLSHFTLFLSLLSLHRFTASLILDVCDQVASACPYIEPYIPLVMTLKTFFFSEYSILISPMKAYRKSSAKNSWGRRGGRFAYAFSLWSLLSPKFSMYITNAFRNRRWTQIILSVRWESL